MPYIASTLATSQKYTAYEQSGFSGNGVARPAVPKHSVLVKGGAGVQGALHTPGGVLTKISDDDLSFLKSHELFQLHEKNGHVKIINREADPEKVARDMDADIGKMQNGMRMTGGSAQLSVDHGDFEEGGRAGGLPPADVQTIV